ncbi:MAG: segregation/condensation protein A [Dehalococcoidia bacterium]
MSISSAEVTVFELKLPVFEGPLDLLLHLIEREELDITTVSLVQVTDQYLAHLRAGDVNAAALADFISVGARLLFLKSRALLPRNPAREQEEADNADELTGLLTEYQQLREVATYFKEIEERGRRSFTRKPGAGEQQRQIPLPMGLGDVTLDALAKIFQETLARQAVDSENTETIQRETVTVADKIQLIKEHLKENGKVSFSELMLSCRNRTEIIVQFLAVLELIKGHKVRARQDSAFGDILLVASTPKPRRPARPKPAASREMPLPK